MPGLLSIQRETSQLLEVFRSRRSLIHSARVVSQHIVRGEPLVRHALQFVIKEFAHELSRKGGIGQRAGRFLAPDPCRHPLLCGADRGVPLDHFGRLAGNTVSFWVLAEPLIGPRLAHYNS